MLQFVKNEEKYHEFMRLLRTDDRIQPSLAQIVEISKEQQREYMKKYNNNYYICLYDGEPAGFIGVFSKEISPLIVHPDYMSKGVGMFLIAEILKVYPELFAIIKLENNPVIGLINKHKEDESLRFKWIGKVIKNDEFWYFIASPGFKPVFCVDS